MAELAKLRSENGELLPAIKEQMLLDTALPSDRNLRALHVSDLVHNDTCWRAVTARMLGLPLPEESFSFTRENIFAEGNTIHRKWQNRMRRTGKLYGQWKCLICGTTGTGLEPGHDWEFCVAPDVSHIWDYDEIPFYHEPLLLVGHADGGVGTAIIELKSVGTGTLRYEAPSILASNIVHRGTREVFDMDGIWNDIRRPFPSHIRQGNMYIWLARQMGMEFDHVVFIYEFKPNQQVKEFSVRPSLGIMKPMLDQAQAVADAVRADQLLDCPSGGCKKCEGVHADGHQEIPAESRPGDEESRPPAGRPGHRRPARGVGQAAAGRSAGITAEPAGPDRPGTDGPARPGEPVEEVPAPPAGSGRSRRVTRESPGSLSRGHSTIQGGREDSSGNESPRPRRRVVRRG